jgi:hypothetical protein
LYSTITNKNELTMTTLRDLLKERGFIETPINTNNAWGFGGVYGKKYTKDGYEVIIGKACYRHAPSHKYVNGYGFVGFRGEITEKSLIKFIETNNI